ncbi:MAG TPA: BON domain-containing protein, partial [Phycisphaerales bacterium]|nr:BON domain-containing protein [Phycisphaerales bacterium]
GQYGSRGQSGWGSQGQQGTQMRAGRGPKGYKRSDERIKEEVCDMLMGAYDLDSEELEVGVKEGEVTLTGSVTSRNDKWEAERLAESVLGVKDVINQLRVKRQSERSESEGRTSGESGSQRGNGASTSERSTTSRTATSART